MEAHSNNLLTDISERKKHTKHNAVTSVRENGIVYVEDKMQTAGLGFDPVFFGISSSFDDTNTSGNRSEI